MGLHKASQGTLHHGTLRIDPNGTALARASAPAPSASRGCSQLSPACPGPSPPAVSFPAFVRLPAPPLDHSKLEQLSLKREKERESNRKIYVILTQCV